MHNSSDIGIATQILTTLKNSGIYFDNMVVQDYVGAEELSGVGNTKTNLR